MRSHWITHKGQKILYCDYTNYPESEFEKLKAELEEVEAVITREPKDSVLGLTDIRGSVATSEVIALFKGAASRTGPHIRMQAVVGVSGVKKVLFDVVVRLSGQNARTFDKVESAKEWLAQASQ
jgi:hypothetical protein